ncbi:MAG: minichromosome maintenance protein MCM [Nanoarchaeota archaeon]
MAEKREMEERIAEAKRFFDTYRKEIGQSIREDKRVIQIDFNDLASFSHKLADELINIPEEIFQILETSLEELGLIKSAKVRLLNVPETQHSKIGHIRAKHLNRLISIEGIVRQASEVRPQVVNAKFECPTCGTIISVLQIEKKFREPSKCSCGRKGQFTLKSKEMVDAQRLVIEESPESLSGGEQPRRMAIFLQEDLVEPRMEEKTTPGARVRVIGVLKEVPIPLPTGSISTRFDLAIEANNLIPLEETYEEVKINDEDERQILELAADPKVFEKLALSIAPSIWGYEEIKRALVLQMFGGCRKVGKDRSVKRGDLHIFLIGDPGVAKSVTLKFISEMAPKGRYIVGKAASGAGITATVVKDEFLKGWALEAGAMVLANKGIVCIDEIEKMDPNDRSAMHEALEQQTVTISKANVQATLQAQTSVLAAGNPKLGRFEPFQTIAQQIDLPPALINRFDVIFVLRDMPDKFRDESIATHVLSQYQKDDRRIPVERGLFRKYVAFAKQKIKPILTDEAVKEIRDFYVKMRNAPANADSAGIKSIPISARQLEALVRLSEAHAKMRLSKKVTKEDSKIAIDIIKYYMMQVGYDSETKSFDIDRIATGVSSSQRSKVILVRESIGKLEERLGKFIPIEELEKELNGKMTRDEIDDSIQKLKASGDIFEPRKGFVQKV